MLARFSLLFVLAAPALAQAQNADSLALVRRAGQLSAMIAGAEVRHDTIFSASFLAQVPASQLGTISTQLASLGRIDKMVMTARPAAPGAPPSSAVFQFTTEKGFAIPVTLVVDAAAPNLVTGLLFGPPTRVTGSLDDMLREFRALPGFKSLYVGRLNGSTLVPVVAEDTARALAIGSAFKLYVLAALVRDVEAGHRHWADVAPLDSLWRSLPSGFLQTWPAGTPITLQTYATLMISISDNTAADHLLHIVGRENVERTQSVAGNSHAALNEPFLSTREMFALKSRDHRPLLERYAAASASDRRAILASADITGRQRSGPDFSGGPVAINNVEWFASTADLARTMVWLRDHSASGPAAAARAVLSVNKGIDWPAANWSYVGFKGGSEPGVLNLTFIAQRKSGDWMVFVASWNDPAKAVDETKLLSLLTRIRDLTAAP